MNLPEPNASNEDWIAYLQRALLRDNDPALQRALALRQSRLRPRKFRFWIKREVYMVSVTNRSITGATCVRTGEEINAVNLLALAIEGALLQMSDRPRSYPNPNSKVRLPNPKVPFSRR